ncbi:glycoside hydrolase domain-containing protein [Pedobacter nyackensis]|uniref:Glycosyl hydrolase family 92 n=1 Tax=Pedobacter nyackensis TaxID=475255 RepID=A0A1W2EYC4_9SPHI|nr:glycoside hydrolase domain-containing protein [Pedobacter nyackensis]SMD14671.1 Glycosyl hydrolase family 92 [Pedobacter nyackensis]
MKHKIFIALSLSIISIQALSQSVQTSEDLTRYVKPNIGSAHSRYFFYTPAALPFGMAKLAPSTNGSYGNASGWEAVGYDERHTSIEGFANFHEFQIGGIVFAPTVGKIHTYPGKMDQRSKGYRSSFNKTDEYATAGYYRVLLKDYQIKAELTATERVGFHQYTFPASDSSNVIFDIGHMMGESGPVLDAKVTYEGNRISGYVITKPVYVQKYQKEANVAMYFYAEIDKSPIAYGSFKDSTLLPDQKSIHSKGAGIYLRFKTKKDEPICIKTGLSYTSVENAKLNLDKEGKHLSFSQAKENAHKRWNENLSRITVNGGKEEDRIKFYTGLFHALLG